MGLRRRARARAVRGGQSKWELRLVHVAFGFLASNISAADHVRVSNGQLQAQALHWLLGRPGGRSPRLSEVLYRWHPYSLPFFSFHVNSQT